MATRMAAVPETKLARLPLLALGFNHVPVVPVDLAAIPDMNA